MSKMFQRISLVLALLLALTGTVAFTSPATVARAQDAETLSYGDTVTGEITEDTSEVVYTFEGAEDDLVIVQVIPIENEDGDTLDVKAVMSDPDDEQLIDTTEDYAKQLTYTYGTAFMEVLGGDGTYTITISADEEGSTGEFEIQLVQPEELELDAPVTIEGSVQGYYRYLGFYTVKAEEDVTLLLTVAEGSGLSLIIEEYDGDYLSRRAYGDGVAAKAMGFYMSPSDAGYYIVSVSSPSYLFEETDFSATLQASAGN
ncbi:MAG: hypothetical protein U0528_17590 [Anaerolineae bacterium]|nr:hypothetical protein [Anaerolineae bacterium]